MRSLRSLLVVSAIWLATSAFAQAGDSASGAISFKDAKGMVKYGFLVRGPDDFEPSKTVLRFYLSSVDIGAKVKAAKTFSEANRALEDGAMVDFSDAPPLSYAVRLNHTLVQVTGGTNLEAFTLTTNKPDDLAGELHFDATASGGAKVDATFDLTLVKTFTSLR